MTSFCVLLVDSCVPAPLPTSGPAVFSGSITNSSQPSNDIVVFSGNVVGNECGYRIIIRGTGDTVDENGSTYDVNGSSDGLTLVDEEITISTCVGTWGTGGVIPALAGCVISNCNFDNCYAERDCYACSSPVNEGNMSNRSGARG